MTEDQHGIDKLFEHVLDRGHCFLCGATLEKGTKTKEHVIPQWLVERFKLHNATITLLNKSQVRYTAKGFTVPSCNVCNNEHLSSLESEISNSVIGGYENFKKLNRTRIYLWLTKIFFGILLAEVNFKKHDSNVVLTLEEISERTKTLHLFLRSVLGNSKFHSDVFSLFVFRTLVFDDPSENFDLMTNIATFSLGMRLNDIGLVVCLEDNRRVEVLIHDWVSRIGENGLAPIQFKEVCAYVFYSATRFENDTHYISMLGELGRMEHVPIPSFTEIITPFHDELYAHIVSRYTGTPIEVINPTPGNLATTLFTESGAFNQLSEVN